MQRLQALGAVSLVVAFSFFGTTESASATTCPLCDLANADIGPCAGPDGMVNFVDLTLIDFCVAHQADFCGRSLSVCDINCDGVVDYRDFGEVFEAFSTGTSAGACVGIYGACCGNGGTDCVLTTAATCDVLTIPDVVPGDGVYAGDGSVCTPNPCDCNGNGIADNMDIADGTSQDCNAKGVPDECDIAIGDSADVMPANGVPDECDPLNRYLFFSMDNLIPGGTVEPHAIRVKLLSVSGFPVFSGEVRWAGPAADVTDEDAGDPLRTFTVSTLQCDSHYADWGTSNLIYINGGDILPGSTYAIQTIALSCGDEASEACFTPASLWTVTTAKWGDVIAPFAATTGSQPDFSDIAAQVAKFLGTPGFPTKARFQLVPNTPAATTPVNFSDISAGVGTFLGVSYIDQLSTSGTAGPCVCPSSVTCGVTPCVGDLDCDAVGGGFCVSGFCTDMCRRCSP